MDTNGPLSHLTADELKAAKMRFAAALLKDPKNPFAVASTLFMREAECLWASWHWLKDPEVIAEQERLIADATADNDQLAFIATKAETARRAWEMQQNSPFVEDQLKALKLFCDIAGYIQKPEGIKIDQSVTNNNRVMLVKDHGTDADWEARLRAQQDNLTAEAAENASTRKH